MLGYCIDIHDEQMQEVMERLKKVRSERNVRLLKALSEIGYEIEKDNIPVGEGGTFIDELFEKYADGSITTEDFDVFVRQHFLKEEVRDLTSTIFSKSS